MPISEQDTNRKIKEIVTNKQKETVEKARLKQ
jgi:hypothetical protein